MKKTLLLLVSFTVLLFPSIGQTFDPGRTVGSIDVSPTGAATYAVPIAVPPGIGGVVPQVALTYNSQGGNGLAGYGWNISGLSAISRIPSTKFHDGFVGGINFDNKDRFALDGQRLILKSGVYGGDGAEYQTENYSNLKIISRGVSPYGASYGPDYFEVYYPDGSKAFYGNDISSKTPTDFAICYTENPIGIRISYSYVFYNNVLTISQIQYGTKGTTPGINQINFLYKDRQRKEQAYIAGQSIYQTKMLSEVNVIANGVDYRNYVLTYNQVATLNYERLGSIQEFSENKTNKFEPISFNYSNTTSNITASIIPNLNLSNIKATNSRVLTSDFTGDGTIDFIVYPKEKNIIYPFWDPSSDSSFGNGISTGSFKEILPVTWLNHNDKILSGQGFVLIKQPADNTIDFEVMSAGISQAVNFQYKKTWTDVPTAVGYSECTFEDIQGGAIGREFLSGDFNGDGLSDILAISKPYSVTNEVYDPNCEDYSNPDCCIQEYPTIPSANVHFINLDRRLTSNFVNYAGSLSKSYTTGDKLIAVDLNGDGKTDVLHIAAGKMYAYSLNTTNGLYLLWETPDAQIVTNFAPLLGDYNGDGKMDVMFPTDDTDVDKNNIFAVFMSTGKAFTKRVRTFPFHNVRPFWNDFYKKWTVCTLIANDINADGKTDIIRTQTDTKDNSTQGTVRITIHQNIGSESDSAPVFAQSDFERQDEVNLIHDPIPVFLSADKPNHTLKVGVLSDHSVTLFEHQKNLKKEVELNSVSQDGITYNIDYQSLDPNIYSNELQTYQSSYDQTFPYVDIQIAPGFKVVNKLRRSFNSIETRQVFGYKAAVSHTEGLGFLGFGEVVRSNWHGDEYDDNKVFSISIHDPQLRGAALKSFTSRSAYISSSITDVDAPQPHITLATPSTGTQTILASQSITLQPGFTASGSNGTFIAKISDPANPINDGSTLSSYITRTDYTYDTELLASKVFVNKPSSVITKDNLSGTGTTAVFTYDSYQNVTKEYTNFSGAGTKTVDVTYDNSTGSSYYIGRPLTRKTTNSNATDTYTAEEQITYTGFLPTQIRKKGHNTAFITEDLQYDTYGNVTQKSVTAGGNTRTTQMQYDASGRFMTKLTDIEGLETTYQYNTANGNITTKTDPDNFSTSYVYDVWGRPKQTTNYLGKSSYTNYEKFGSTIKISSDNDEGSSSYKIINALGQTTEANEKDVIGNWVGILYRYDIYGRQNSISEPGMGNYSQWNETFYDTYGRVNKTTSYTGKETNISYNGLSTTVNDGTKTVTTTKNALGNVVSVTDPGGTINYTYYANGNLKSADFAGSIQSIEQDGWGRKTKLTDPSAGVYTYTYNEFGETTAETTPKGSTAYTYDVNGKLLTKKIKGDATDMSYAYTYDGTTKLLASMGLTNTDGNNAAYTYAYDTYKRISSVVEDNLHARFTKTLIYDSFGRVATETSQAKNKANNKIVSKTLLNSYQYGELKSITDNITGEKIWEVTALNARGQVTTALLGSTMKQTNAYDTYGYPSALTTDRIGTNPGQLMQLGYSFDPQRGNLDSRSNTVFGWNESFIYDNQDRLKNFDDNNGTNSQTYDNRGRINNNSALGDYVFSGTSYQQIGLKSLTTGANTYYKASRRLQQITYNAFKSPVDITEQGREKISFQYNAAQGRSHMYYGDEQVDKMSRRYRRHYSEGGSMEITEDGQTNTTSFVFYMGGDAYSAPAIWKEEYTASSTTQNLYYLYRDHLGSIVLITDNQGTVKEKRQFDAWGNVVKLQDGNGNELTAFQITDRGYTGHEHLMGVALIHMNGRLYDPKLHRFLSPDNFVQDPSNTQNFNRYGYVLNNPLSFNDPTGEFLHIIIGAAVGGVINLTVKAVQGKIGSFKDGAAAFGIGAVAGGLGAATGGASLAASGLAGASIAGGALAGATGVAIASPIQGLGNMAYFGDKYSLKHWGRDVLIGGVTGGVIGGASAYLKGKNIWLGKDIGKGRNAFSFNNSDIGPKGSVTAEPLRIDAFDDIASPDFEQVDLKLNVGKQNIHHGSTQIEGRSYLTSEPNSLLKDLNSGRFINAGVNHRGMPIVKFNQNIGNVLNLSGQNLGPTPFGVVHINSQGQVHIVPYLFKR